MASLLRNSRLIMMGLASVRRTATTVAANATTQAKAGGNLAVRKSTPADPIKPRPVGEQHLPLIGTALNTWGQVGLGVVLAISAYFIYINYITNAEFYKSLNVSREASKRDKEEKAAHHGGSAGKKGDSGHGKH